jgi:hypothetical protein
MTTLTPGFEVGQELSNDYAGKTFVRWGPEEEADKKVSAVFKLQVNILLGKLEFSEYCNYFKQLLAIYHRSSYLGLGLKQVKICSSFRKFIFKFLFNCSFQMSISNVHFK